MTKRYLGNIITQNPAAPAGDLANSAAKGVWSLEEQLAYQKAGLWPVPGNFPLDVEDVFSTTLYTGNGQDGTVITNDIDLDGEGGLIWIKRRNAGTEHLWQDSARGAGTGTSYKQIFSNLNSAQNTTTNEGVTSFNSNGFTIDNGGDINQTGNPYASWSWRKAPKFFDVVTYTGNGTARTISHNLGTAPGLIICKCTSGSGNWKVWHRSFSNGASGVINLNLTGAETSNTTVWNNTLPTDSVFSLGTSTQANENNKDFVAYLFAHNDGDGGFGADGDADIIKCGSFTMGTTVTVDLGFEPQWLMVKKASGTGQWMLVDNMRGWNTDSDVGTSIYQKMLYANLNNAEGDASMLYLNSTGFTADSTGTGDFIYMAIRRGTKVPESATEVFAPNFYGTSGYVGYLGAPADMSMLGYRNGGSQNAVIRSRMLPNTKGLVTSSTAAEVTTNSSWDNMLGVSTASSTITTLISWTWKRAPGFFDAVAYTGDGTTDGSHQISHNLGVAPEMIIYKDRNLGASWLVWHTGLGQDGSSRYYSAILNSSGAKGLYNVASNSNLVNPQGTDTYFPVGGSNTNPSGYNYIAYLFATLDGISKCGSYTGNGSSQTIDCGFTSGARFILIKRTDGNGDWYVWDTARGIVAGNDARLELNTTDSENDNVDEIDPHSSGFIVNDVGGGQSAQINGNNDEYIFYAIA